MTRKPPTGGFLISEVRASSSNNVRRAAIVARFFPPIRAPQQRSVCQTAMLGDISHSHLPILMPPSANHGA